MPKKMEIIINGKEVDQKTISRFWDRVDIHPSKDECWEWQAGLNSKKEGYDYGIFWVNGGSVLAHRLALSFHLGKYVKAQEVMHHCDNPRCCNPYHLLAANHLENMRDMNRKGRRICEKGVERYNAKLDDAKVRNIRKLYKKHLKYKKYNFTYLAKKYKVDRVLIRKVINKTAWKHVED